MIEHHNAGWNYLVEIACYYRVIGYQNYLDIRHNMYEHSILCLSESVYLVASDKSESLHVHA